MDFDDKIKAIETAVEKIVEVQKELEKLSEFVDTDSEIILKNNFFDLGKVTGSLFRMKGKMYIEAEIEGISTRKDVIDRINPFFNE